jgi:radical SAM family uncharacterized protein/radical SAM-linked protein
VPIQSPHIKSSSTGRFMNFRELLECEIMPQVEKPSRYLGSELNSVHKDPASVDLRVSLVFPDLYDLGLGNLGILILYSILNDLDWCWCERAYAPAPDMEAQLRDRNLPLFNNESKDSLADMDMIGVTLQSELTYTNILNIIDLAGLPIRTADRAEDAPLIFAGGPAVFNPEPLAPFFDFFVIGEGEDAISEIAETVRNLKQMSRLDKLNALAQLEGVYVPELYPFETTPNGQILPKEDAPKIRKRVVETLDGAKFPTKYIVPYTEQVHDRLSLEVLRGCTQGCRFCQAGMVTRPVRERSLENIDQLMKESLENTGYEEVSLVSLSTCDYSRPRMLVEQAADQPYMEHTSVSLPSLRLDSFAVEMADRVADVRRSGLTFAPEAASPRLRAVINKWIPDEELLNMSSEAFQRGWKHVKCYFMIGLPTERDEDIEAIIDLCKRTLEKGRTINHAAKVNLGVSTFVPKPFTPFQWAAQIDMDETERRQNILDEGFRKERSIKFGRHTAETTFIEGLVTRADRRGANLIEAAWKRGARFESWDEFCDIKLWLQAIEDVDYDVAFELRERDIHERLPWDHIDVLMPKEWFQEDWERAMEYKHAQDCRAGKCHMCGVIFKEQELCSHMLRNQRRGRIEEKTWEPKVRPTYVEPEPVQRIRLKIGWQGEVRFLSHLERQNVWIRALRRARVPLSYSQGFHAHPKINFSMASPVGEECQGELMDILIKEHTDPGLILSRLNDVLPPGFTVYGAIEVSRKFPSLSSSITGVDYSIVVPNEEAGDIQTKIEAFLSADECIVQRKVKQRKKGRRRGPNHSPKTVDFNVRPYIDQLELESRQTDSGSITLVNFHTISIEQKMGKPKEIMELLGISPHRAWVIKREIQIQNTPGAVAESGQELESATV